MIFINPLDKTNVILLSFNTAAARAAFYMARERIHAEIEFCLNAHGHEIHGHEVVDLEPQEVQYIEPTVQPEPEQAPVVSLPTAKSSNSISHSEIEAIFREDQERIPHTISTRYHLLDESISQRNPDCPPDIIEDDYSSNSRP